MRKSLTIVAAVRSNGAMRPKAGLKPGRLSGTPTLVMATPYLQAVDRLLYGGPLPAGQAAGRSARSMYHRKWGPQLMALHHANPGEVVALAPIGPSLRRAKTAALVKGRHFEAVRLILHAGAEIPQHKVSGEITLHCLEGHVELGIDPKPIVLKANDWVYLEGGAPHSVKAVEDSSLLLTIFLNHALSEK